ncbi:alpha/beta hydrolase [Desulfobotulus sp.]|uniref:alpha/beta hydrolase n=1 Tax=Desulfobotulus sp. TaxID=1940337 RepID=UPI002A365087|nr:alpha/beta hydrolase [Desulfobotulus sp.]MDY0161738.1 alpha/beta hydrolase [Desulfobotulus sp.]
MNKEPIAWVKEAAFLGACDGLPLRYHIGFPPKWHAGDPIVILLTGRAECLDKYDRVQKALLERGVAVLRKDWRGQGGSGRMLPDSHKGHVTDFALYLDDLQRILQIVVTPLQPGGLVLMGHSMGSHLALRHLLSGAKGVCAAILESPMFSIDTWPLPYGLVRKICTRARAMGLEDRYIPAGGPFRADLAFKGNNLTGDPEHFFRFQNFLIQHPSMQMGAPTLGWLHAASLSMDQLWQELKKKKLDTPILMLSGEADQVVRPKDHRKACTFLPRGICVSFPKGRHELFMERAEIRQMLWQHVDVFGRQQGFFPKLPAQV